MYLCSIIERWNLTQFDVKESETAAAWYRVRKTWEDAKTQKGAYKILENAKKCADANPGYTESDGTRDQTVSAQSETENSEGCAWLWGSGCRYSKKCIENTGI